MTLICDIDGCDEFAEYSLCQEHLDEMRFPDVECSTDMRNGNHPPEGLTVIFEINGLSFIGGYDTKRKQWFDGEEMIDDTNETSRVYWSPLPNLQVLHEDVQKLRDNRNAK